MLLVAQRVISTTRRVQGVNAYRYRHGRDPWPADPRVMLDHPSKTLASGSALFPGARGDFRHVVSRRALVESLDHPAHSQGG